MTQYAGLPQLLKLESELFDRKVVGSSIVVGRLQRMGNLESRNLCAL